MDLAEAVLEDRRAAYVRLRGGYPFPIAGIFYWGALSVLGLFVTGKTWGLWAFIGSGSIFPLALLFGALFRVPFMADKTAVSTLLGPAFLSMLLFWPMAIAAFWSAPDLVPLILAIGMSIHWPIIGWSYGRVPIYAAHALVRALAVFAIWVLLPEARFTLVPLAVAIIYALTTLALYIDSGRMARLKGGHSAAR